MSKNKYSDKTLKELYEIKEKYGKKILTYFPSSITLSILSYAANSISFLLLSLFAEYKCFEYLTKISSFIGNYKIDKSLEYEKLYKSYMTVLEEVLKLFKTSNADNEIKMFAMYIYLYRKGFLSLNHEFYYSKPQQEFKHSLGTDVIYGEGCCRHINSMLTDLLNLNNNQSYNISMNIDDSFLEFTGAPPLQKRQKEENDIIVTGNFKGKKRIFLDIFFDLIIRSNHLATLFVSEGNSYIMDATNNAIFSIQDKKAFNFQSFDIGYERFCNDDKKIKLSKLLKDTNLQKLELLLKDYNDVINMCKECDDIFEKFYREHKDLYGEVVDRRKILENEISKYDIFKN